MGFSYHVVLCVHDINHSAYALHHSVEFLPPLSLLLSSIDLTTLDAWTHALSMHCIARSDLPHTL